MMDSRVGGGSPTKPEDAAQQRKLQEEVHSLKQQLVESSSMVSALREQLSGGDGGSTEPLSPTSRVALELEVHELRARLAASELNATSDRYIKRGGDTSTIGDHGQLKAAEEEVKRLSMQLESSKIMCSELQARLAAQTSQSTSDAEKAMLKHELQVALEAVRSMRQHMEMAVRLPLRQRSCRSVV